MRNRAVLLSFVVLAVAMGACIPERGTPPDLGCTSEEIAALRAERDAAYQPLTGALYGLQQSGAESSTQMDAAAATFRDIDDQLRACGEVIPTNGTWDATPEPLVLSASNPTPFVATLTMTNVGVATDRPPSVINAPTFSGFAVTPLSCAAPFPTGATCTYRVEATVSATTGSRLMVHNGEGGQVDQVPVSPYSAP